MKIEIFPQMYYIVGISRNQKDERALVELLS